MSLKAKDLSLLIVHEDKTLRELLAALVNSRYRSVTAAAPEELGSLITLKSFDMMIAPRSVINSPAEKAGDSGMAERVTTVAAITSGLTGKIYEFRSINQNASSWVINPFERVFLEVAIERSELSLRQVQRINEHDAEF
jgi:hypothetical protein